MIKKFLSYFFLVRFYLGYVMALEIREYSLSYPFTIPASSREHVINIKLGNNSLQHFARNWPLLWKLNKAENVILYCLNTYTTGTYTTKCP